MRYLLFISLFLPLCDFAQQPSKSPGGSVSCFKSALPRFTSDLYSASVDVVGRHISGLVFVKSMPDSSQRVVFSNETGITYFDFEWNKKGEFKTYHVIKKLKKKVVLKTLRKDFELIVVPASLRTGVHAENEREFSVVRSKESLKFSTDEHCSSVKTIGVSVKKSNLVEGRFFPEGKNIPDSVSIVHHNFNMKIGLKKIAR